MVGAEFFLNLQEVLEPTLEPQPVLGGSLLSPLGFFLGTKAVRNEHIVLACLLPRLVVIAFLALIFGYLDFSLIATITICCPLWFIAFE